MRCFNVRTYLNAALIVTICMSVAHEKIYAAKCPCDIYADGGTPCVAAHSTVRALYADYDGPLYQVQRKSDNKLLDIPLLAKGGYVNAAVVDSFLKGSSGTVNKIYDQSDKKNDLPISPPVKWLPKGGVPALAQDTSVFVNGHKVYGIKTYPDANGPGMGGGGNTYRNNQAKGLATGDQPEGMYAVVDANYYNDRCCFDYGNAETDGQDDGKATMECIEYGNMKTWSYGSGKGPWIFADLEDGVFAGGQTSGLVSVNTPVVAKNFAMLMIKGNSGDHMTLKTGDAQTGKLEIKYDSKRPPGYSPQRKQGAVELGTGGDGSSGGKGIFYEGAITFGLPPDSIDNAIQANVIAAGYGKAVTLTRFSGIDAKTPSIFKVNYNPSTAIAVISYALPNARRVSMHIIDQRGRRVAAIENGVMPAGTHTAVWNAGRAAAGVYMWSAEIDGMEVGSGRIIVGK